MRNIPPEREKLEKIAEIARLAPSACNSQPWKFIVIDSPEAKEKLCDAIVVDGGVTGAPWRHNVSAFIVFVEQIAKEPVKYIDVSKDGFWLAKANLCDADHIMVVFSDCSYLISSTRTTDDQYDFTLIKCSDYNKTLCCANRIGA